MCVYLKVTYFKTGKTIWLSCYFFIINFISFIFNFLFHNSHDKFDRQITVSNQINQTDSWRKQRCCAWVQKRVAHHQGLNSWSRALRTLLIFRAKYDTTQLYRHPNLAINIIGTVYQCDQIGIFDTISNKSSTKEWQLFDLFCKTLM